MKIENLQAGYHKNIIIRDCNLSVEKGEIVSLIGPNGGGKSTILKSISGQLKPLGGKVFLGKDEIRQISVKDLARRMSIVTTDRIKPEHMTCRDVMLSGRLPYSDRFGFMDKEDGAAADRAMELMNITGMADKHYSALSDGQKQRTLIARAICQEPEYLIMDEPTSYLDIRYKMELMDVIRKLSQEGCSIIMSLHEPSLAMRVSHKILLVSEDGSVDYRDPQAIIENDMIKELYGLTDDMYETVKHELFIGNSTDKSINKSKVESVDTANDGKYKLISFTDRGKKISDRLADELGSQAASSYKDMSLNEWTRENFREGKILVFIGAVGIAVRAIAPFVKDKKTDPGVVVVDEGGSFVIPLLSGHLGGAIDAAKEIGKIIGATEVITTATDLRGEFAVDVYAKRNGMEIGSMELAKEFTANLLRCGKGYLYIDEEYRDVLHGADPVGNVEFTEGCNGVSPCAVISPRVQSKEKLTLIPKCIVLGVGCKKGKTFEELRSFLEKELADKGIDKRAVKAVASIDLKKDESGLIELARSLSAKFVTFSSEKLMEQKGDFTSSEFAMEVTGADNVCERAAIACGCKRLILKKTAENGMTLAIGVLDITLESE